jgi:hypothetical protein
MSDKPTPVPDLQALVETAQEVPPAKTEARSSSVPDLVALAASTAAPAAAISASASAGGGVQLRVTVSDDEAPTAEYRTVVEQKLTSPYHPPVAKLIDRLEQPEVAPEPTEDPRLVELRLMVQSVQGHVADLKEHTDPEDARRPKLVALAQQTVDEARALLAKLPAEPPLVERRDELVHHERILERLIAQCTPKPKEVEATSEPPPPTAEERQQLQEEAQRHHRRNIFLVVLGLLLAGRLALLIPTRASTAVEQKRTEGEVHSVNRAGGATEEELSEGIPSVLEVRLTQEAGGSLRARALAVDPNGDPLTLTFTWLENGNQIEVEPLGVLPVQQVMAGASYVVEVTASDGTHRSHPLTTLPLVVDRGSKGTLSAVSPQPARKTKAAPASHPATTPPKKGSRP